MLTIFIKVITHLSNYQAKVCIYCVVFKKKFLYKKYSYNHMSGPIMQHKQEGSLPERC